MAPALIHDDIPVGVGPFLREVRAWDAPSLGSTAFALQSWQMLGYTLPERICLRLIELVRRHWVADDLGFANRIGEESTVFGCWSARSILRVVFEELRIGRPGDFRASIVAELLDDPSRPVRWAEGLTRCLTVDGDGEAGYRETPADNHVGPVTSDAALTVLSELGAVPEPDVLRSIAEFEAAQCLVGWGIGKDKVWVGSYLPQSSGNGERSLCDGTATRHILSKYERYLDFSFMRTISDRLDGLRTAFYKCSSSGKAACVAYPGCTVLSIKDTQAWYDVYRMVELFSGRPSNGNSRLPTEMGSFLRYSQDPTGGFGFAEGLQPNVYATRAAAMIYSRLVLENPALALQLQDVRSKMARYLLRLREPGDVLYRGVVTSVDFGAELVSLAPSL